MKSIIYIHPILYLNFCVKLYWFQLHFYVVSLHIITVHFRKYFIYTNRSLSKFRTTLTLLLYQHIMSKKVSFLIKYAIYDFKVLNLNPHFFIFWLILTKQFKYLVYWKYCFILLLNLTTPSKYPVLKVKIQINNKARNRNNQNTLCNVIGH